MTELKSSPRSWPEAKDPYFLRERQNRRIAITRFIMQTNDRVEKVFGSYYCRTNPKARSVRLWRTIRHMANLHDVASGARTIDDGKGAEKKYVSQYLCEVKP